MLITEKQMWTKFRSIQKKTKTEICCDICKKRIDEGETDVVYVKTRRGTELFVHKDCISEW